MKLDNQKLSIISNKYRLELFEKFYQMQQGHPGSVFGILDFLTVLFYNKFIKIKKNKLLDKLIISKGHATSATYPFLRDFKILSKKEWDNWGANNESCLRVFGNTSIPGVSVTTGSLGHGLGVAAGMATANLKDKINENIFVIISEGELYEGSTWETLLYLSHYKLKKVKIIIDVNNLIILGTTNDSLRLNPIHKKIEGLGFKTLSINGHQFDKINDALKKITSNKIDCIILNTIKGKGLKMMENKPAWHYWHKMEREVAKESIKELKNKI